MGRTIATALWLFLAGCSLVLDPSDLMPSDASSVDTGGIDGSPPDGRSDAGEDGFVPDVRSDGPPPDGGGEPGFVEDVAAGRAHTCAIANAGRVYCWGANAHGQVGQPAGMRVDGPTEVPDLREAERVSLGENFSCVLLADGTVRCWGENDAEDNRLGDPTFSGASTHVPREVSGISDASDIDVGFWHGCALIGGEVRCWGQNDSGELGMCSTAPVCDDIDGSTLVVGLTGGPYGDVAAGSGSSCAVDGERRLSCWGFNEGEQLGVAGTTPLEPSLVLADVSRVWAGGGRDFTGDGRPFRGQICALFAPAALDPALYCWGANDRGQVSSDTVEVVTRPTPVTVLPDVSEVGLGYSHTCAIYDRGQVTCWGSNEDGRGGRTVAMDQRGPVDGDPIAFVGASGAPDRLAAGGQHTCARFDDGSLFCWGNNGEGQLGDPTVGFTSSMPIRVPVPEG